MGHNEDLYDVIIAGAGPAGLSAAIYMARARYRVLVMEKEKIGGQITITSEIVNYPGVERTSGRELTRSMKEQAEVFVIGGALPRWRNCWLCTIRCTGTLPRCLLNSSRPG